MLIRRSSKNIWRSIAKWTHMHKPQNGCFPTFLFCDLTGIRRRQELSFMPPQNFGGRVKTAKHCLDQKLQTDKLSILVRFLKKLVALVGDVSQMYHQLALTPEDRKQRRCLWRDLDQSKEPEVWEFLRYVFGGGGGLLLTILCTVCMAEACRWPQSRVLSLSWSGKEGLLPGRPHAFSGVEIAKEVRKQLTGLGSKDVFHIRKRISQKTEVIEDTPHETSWSGEERVSGHKDFGDSVDCWRQVFVLVQPTTRVHSK